MVVISFQLPVRKKKKKEEASKHSQYSFTNTENGKAPQLVILIQYCSYKTEAPVTLTALSCTGNRALFSIADHSFVEVKLVYSLFLLKIMYYNKCLNPIEIRFFFPRPLYM